MNSLLVWHYTSLPLRQDQGLRPDWPTVAQYAILVFYNRYKAADKQ